jgi:hypothetical protein
MLSDKCILRSLSRYARVGLGWDFCQRLSTFYCINYEGVLIFGASSVYNRRLYLYASAVLSIFTL